MMQRLASKESKKFYINQNWFVWGKIMSKLFSIKTYYDKENDNQMLKKPYTNWDEGKTSLRFV